jgi:hypothetical protein
MSKISKSQAVTSHESIFPVISFKILKFPFISVRDGQTGAFRNFHSFPEFQKKRHTETRQVSLSHGQSRRVRGIPRTTGEGGTFTRTNLHTVPKNFFRPKNFGAALSICYYLQIKIKKIKVELSTKYGVFR